MKKTEDMIRESKIWAGLNKPDVEMDDADVIVFGIPYDGSVSFRSGAKDAPSSLREITYTIAPTTEYFEDISHLKICDIGDFQEESREFLFKKVEDKVYDIVSKGKFFTMIGGDHSTTIPVQRGIDRALNEEFGIIHIDAHFDLCDQLDKDKLSHGSTERRALELENVSSTENIFFIGIRSIEMDELKFMKENHINVINAHEFSAMGVEQTLERVKEKMDRFNKIYITVDIDCLDPGFAPGTGTPQFGGLTGRELLDLLKGLFDLPVIGFDVVEIAPKLDSSLTAVFAGRKIIIECWGHKFLKR